MNEDSRETNIIVSADQLTQLKQLEDSEHINLNVIHRHYHEYRGNGLLEAFLALLVVILFIFGTSFLYVASLRFSQSLERSYRLTDVP